MTDIETQYRHRHPGLWQTCVKDSPRVTTMHWDQKDELTPMIQCLATVAAESGWILLINAPDCDWSRLIQKVGDLGRRILRINCADEIEAMLAFEQALTKSHGVYAAIYAWLPMLDRRDNHRLQLIQKRANCPGVIYQVSSNVLSDNFGERVCASEHQSTLSC